MFSGDVLMATRRGLFVAVLLTFCFSAVLFVALPIRSQTPHVYDPWADVSGPIHGESDGTINMRDISYEIMHFNTHGTPINKTALYSNWYDGLVGFWKLDEGAGNITLDNSGNGNNGTLRDGGNGAPEWVDGKYGNALSFNLSCVVVPDTPILQLHGYCNFTLEAWIYMTQRPYESNDYAVVIVNKLEGGSEGGSVGYALQFDNPTSTNDNLILAIGGGPVDPFPGITLVQYNSINDLTLNQWHHIAATYDNDGMTATLYIDGIPKASNTLTDRHWIASEGLTLSFGAHPIQNPTPSIPPQVECFTGLIDNVMIYNRTLSAEEVVAHYVLPPP